jgi:DNA end-binding protein Ku
MWSGVLSLALLNVPVTVAKAVDDSSATFGLKRLCSCHKEPFTRPSDTCPGGSHPETDTAIRRGDENLTPVVYGVEGPDGYIVIPDEKMEEIADSTELDGLQVDRVVDAGDIPWHLVNGLYYLRANDKVNGAKHSFALLQRKLAARDEVAISQWQRRGSTDLVLVHSHGTGDQLVLNTIPYRALVREPDDKALAHADEALSDREVELADTLMDEFTGEFEYGSFVDAGTEAYNDAIAEFVDSGEMPEPVEKAEPTKAPDVMAALEASVESLNGDAPKPRKKAAVKKATKKRAKAKATA